MRGALLLVLSTLIVAPSLYSQQQDNTARAAYHSGEQALRDGDYYVAIEHFRTAVNRNERYLDPIAGLAQSYFELNEFDQALRFAERARELAPYRIDLKLLHARLLVATGSIERAESLYREILEEQPYDVGARVGLAELSVARGATERADQLLRDAARLEPSNKKTLLSLAVLAEYRGRPEDAERYIERALESHPRDADVQSLAAEHFLSSGEYERAATHVRTAVQLRPDRTDVLLLEAEVALMRGRYEEALNAAGSVVERDRTNGRAWYLQAVAQEGLGEIEESSRSFTLGLRAHPGDEALRIRYESMVLDHFGQESDTRARLADYHFEEAQSLKGRNLFDLSAQELRRGLKLNPFDREGRLAYAELLRLRGLNGRYLEQLKVLREQGHNDTEVTDRIEIYESVRADSIASRWNIEQFNVERDRITVGLFAVEGSSRVDYPQLVPSLIEYVHESLLSHEHISATREQSGAVTSYAEAFRRARTNGNDYFVILRFREFESTLEITAELYAARSGNKVAEYAGVRVGNDRFRDAADAVSDAIAAELPLRGTVIRRDGGRVVLNLGRVHGLEVNESLLVLRAGSLVIAGETPGFSYGEDDILGTVSVEALDDVLAEGTIERSGAFDLVSVGNRVVLESAEAPSEAASDAFLPIYRRIRSIR